MTAAEDWTKQVITVPINKKERMVRYESTSNDLKKSMIAGLFSNCSSFPATLSSTRLKNMKESPKRKSPI